MAVDVTRRPRFYQACSGCRREFFDREEYENHSCFKLKRGFDPNGLLGRSGVVGASPATPEQAKASEREDVLKNSNPNTGIADAADTVATDLRLEAAKEITRMKQELVLAGIEAQTLNADETRKEYARMQEAQKAASSADAGSSAQQQPQTAAKASAGRKGRQQTARKG